jgi:hypothetical protein
MLITIKLMSEVKRKALSLEVYAIAFITGSIKCGQLLAALSMRVVLVLQTLSVLCCCLQSLAVAMQDPAFQQAMLTAQEKFQELMKVLI